MNQEKKKKIAPEVKAILKKYGLKGSLSVKDYSTLTLTVSSGMIDFIKNYQEEIIKRYGEIEPWQISDHIDVNPYHADKEFTGIAREAVCELLEAMFRGNHDNSNPMIDYFDVGWYVRFYIGTWNKPYQLV